MNRKTNNLTRAFAESFLTPEPILEIGSFQVPGQEHVSDLRPYFQGKEYIGSDMRMGPGVDRVENAERLSFADSSVGTIIMLDTLEHAQNCQKIMSEVHRVLKDGGTVLMSSVMDFNIHDYPSDYWRFTPEAFRYLLNGFNRKFVGYDGDPLKPRIVFAIGIKNADKDYADSFLRFKRRYLELNGKIRFKLFNLLLAIRPILRFITGKANKIEIKEYND